MWEAVSGKLLRTYTGHKSFVLSVAWSPDGTHIASASDDQTVQVWEAVSGCLLRTYTGHAGTVWSVAWSPDGTRIASASFDRTVQVWEAKSGNLLRTYTGHAGTVNSVAWSPDDTRIASASDDRTVQVWEAVSGNLLRTYTGHSRHCRGCRVVSRRHPHRFCKRRSHRAGVGGGERESASDLQLGMEAPSIVWHGLPMAPASLRQALVPRRCGKR